MERKTNQVKNFKQDLSQNERGSCKDTPYPRQLFCLRMSFKIETVEVYEVVFVLEICTCSRQV